MASLNPHAADLGITDIRKISNRIYERDLDVIRLDIGEPDLPTSEHITAAAQRSAAGGTHYTAGNGTRQLRGAVAGFLADHRGVEVPPEEIVVTTGATGALIDAFTTLIRPGDEILVPTPGYPNYSFQISLCGGRPVSYPLHPETGWTPDPEEIERAVTPRTKAIVINSPSNPTGGCIAPETMGRIAELARRHDLFVIADEVYDELVFEGEALNAISFDRDRTIGVYSASKTYSMTGWRLGWLVAPPALAGILTRVNSQLVSSASSVAQDAAVAALSGPQDDVARRRDVYRARRDFVTGRLAALGVDAVAPRGAFYYMVPLPAGTDSLDGALTLLDEGVAVIPGTAFGENGRPAFRLALTTPVDRIGAGLDLIAGKYLS